MRQIVLALLFLNKVACLRGRRLVEDPEDYHVTIAEEVEKVTNIQEPDISTSGIYDWDDIMRNWIPDLTRAGDGSTGQ